MNYTICTLPGVSRCKMIGPVKHTWLPWVLCMPPFSPSWYCHSLSVPGPCHWPPCPSGDGDSHTATGSPPSPVRSCPVHPEPSLDSFSTFRPPSWHLQFKNSHKDIQIFLKVIKTLFRICLWKFVTAWCVWCYVQTQNYREAEKLKFQNHALIHFVWS